MTWAIKIPSDPGHAWYQAFVPGRLGFWGPKEGRHYFEVRAHAYHEMSLILASSPSWQPTVVRVKRRQAGGRQVWQGVDCVGRGRVPGQTRRRRRLRYGSLQVARPEAREGSQGHARGAYGLA
jgi:hypothetical protein